MKISVITCVYNGQKFLNDYLDNVNAIKDELFEVIIVNDGSTDSTSSICKEIKIPIVRVVEKDNTGLPDSRNVGLSEAAGDFVIFLDVDDSINLSVLKEVKAKLKSELHDIAVTNVRYFSEKGFGQYKVQNYLRRFALPRVSNLSKKIFYNNFLVTPSVLIINRSYAEKILFDPDLTIGEDWEFFSRALQTKKKILINKPLVNYYVAESSMSSSTVKNKEKVTLLVQKLSKNSLLLNGEKDDYVKYLEVVVQLFQLKRDGFVHPWKDIMTIYFSCYKHSPLAYKLIFLSLIKYTIKRATLVLER